MAETLFTGLASKDRWSKAQEILVERFEIRKPDAALDYMRHNEWHVDASKGMLERVYLDFNENRGRGAMGRLPLRLRFEATTWGSLTTHGETQLFFEAGMIKPWGESVGGAVLASPQEFFMPEDSILRVESKVIRDKLGISEFIEIGSDGSINYGRMVRQIP